ncbi:MULTISPECIES: hypothetical protein [unclassified Synechococcus]|uniref:hypothetical protein n=1 Tax=unclassified Synechococcus TaxID=2626047 RepID=UPI0000698E80|nr:MULTISPECIES: hypothetical protein [unclassified Synechococcus]EAQ73737.1 hypothetical protein WH5701_12858 [Synechococcus sp. WH 5701]MCP9826662.1 hypothetical protein [Synechococcus sp. EJ6-Ellesmere]WFN58466.1 hypothetical protein N4320_11705 [Synechococcus sp. CCFWC 502]
MQAPPLALPVRRPLSAFAALTLAAVVVMGLGWVSRTALGAEPPAYKLECRLENGPWHPCVMTVESVGERWQIDLEGLRVIFRHDGRGSVEMRRSSGPWQPVSGRWQDDHALCWDGVCAKGSFPLD